MPNAKLLQRTLANNARLLLYPNSASPSVAVSVLVGVGSRYESSDNNGISHFLEHMGFKGTKRRPSTLEIASEVDNVGGESNAFTSKEYTGYYVKVAAKELPMAVDLLDDMLFSSLYQPEEVERERGVIVEEINMYRDSPRDQAAEMYDQLIYPNQPLGMEIAGTPQSLATIGHAQLKDFADTWYTPDNMIISLAGRFNDKHVDDVITKTFATHSAKAVGTFQPVHQDQDQPQIVTKNKDIDQTQLIVGVRAYPATHPARYALALLNIVLGGNMSSRLFTQVRERRGLAYAVNSSLDDFVDAGSLVCSAGLGHANTAPALTVILDLLKDIRQQGITAQELQQAKQYMRGRLALSMEDVLSVAIFHSRQWLLEGNIRTIDEILTQVEQVTVADIRQVAKEIFTPDRLNLAVIGPHVNQSELDKIIKQF